eukprot:11198639-Alexandrium_andersonii.AAC.1
MPPPNPPQSTPLARWRPIGWVCGGGNAPLARTGDTCCGVVRRGVSTPETPLKGNAARTASRLLRCCVFGGAR